MNCLFLLKYVLLKITFKDFIYLITMQIKVVIFIISFFSLFNSLDNGVGLKPPMGWNSWNHFGCNISQSLIKKTAQLLISTGLAAKGYQFVNLDDCWQISRNSTTNQILQDRQKFPNGIQYLSNYLHQKNLKIGLYSDAGQKTCQGRPGSFGFQTIDANTYANWKIDYLKYDNCYHPQITAKLRYYAMKKALNQTGRHIFYSMCNWGEQNSPSWAKDYANSWRTTGDIQDNWKSFIAILDQQAGLQNYSGKGGWNDPDMLEVGNGGMNFNQYQAHFSFWAALKAPLLIGCSLQNITNQTLSILGNQQLIEINQDQLGIQAKRVIKEIDSNGVKEVWGGPLADERFVIIFFNQGQINQTMRVSLKNQFGLLFESYVQRDPIRHKNIGSSNNNILSVDNVEPHSVQVRILKLYKTLIQEQ